MREVETNW